eukprot:353921-Chlamydomonas_euryale.AAC.3
MKRRHGEGAYRLGAETGHEEGARTGGKERGPTPRAAGASLHPPLHPTQIPTTARLPHLCNWRHLHCDVRDVERGRGAARRVPTSLGDGQVVVKAAVVVDKAAHAIGAIGERQVQAPHIRGHVDDSLARQGARVRVRVRGTRSCKSGWMGAFGGAMGAGTVQDGAGWILFWGGGQGQCRKVRHGFFGGGRRQKQSRKVRHGFLGGTETEQEGAGGCGMPSLDMLRAATDGIAWDMWMGGCPREHIPFQQGHKRGCHVWDGTPSCPASHPHTLGSPSGSPARRSPATASAAYRTPCPAAARSRGPSSPKQRSPADPATASTLGCSAAPAVAQLPAWRAR